MVKFSHILICLMIASMFATTASARPAYTGCNASIAFSPTGSPPVDTVLGTVETYGDYGFDTSCYVYTTVPIPAVVENEIDDAYDYAIDVRDYGTGYAQAVKGWGNTNAIPFATATADFAVCLPFNGINGCSAPTITAPPTPGFPPLP
jgi:hypothetical protein